MPLGELSLPSYLVPPSPVQRQQLDLEREQLKDRQRERASQQLMRAVGMAKMNKETQDLINQGVDETTARKRAFLNNAQLVMPPGADISHFITQDEAQQVRQQALLERRQHNQEMFEATLNRLQLQADIAGTKRERDDFKNQIDLLKTYRQFDKDKSDYELKKAKETALDPQQKERDDYVKLKRQEPLLQKLAIANPQRGDVKQMLTDVQNGIQAWEVQHGATEETVEATPGGGVSIRRGKAPASSTPDVLTTQNLSKAQDSMNQSVMTIEAANRLAPLISSETVGPRAFAESWVKDRFLANLYPELASQKRITAERFAAELRSTTIRELRSDGNISEKERGQILAAVPEINDPIDSPQRARDLIEATKKTAAIRAVVTARRMRTTVPPAAAKALEDTDLLRMADSGLITKQEAQMIWKLKRQP